MGDNTIREVLKRRSEDTQRRIMRRRKPRKARRSRSRPGGLGRLVFWLLILAGIGGGIYWWYFQF